MVRDGRAKVEIAVGVRTLSRTFQAKSSDVGVGGLFLVTDLHLELEELIALEFTLPNHVRPLSVEAEVRWHRQIADPESGMGLRFVRPSFGTIIAIHEFLRRL